MKLAIRIALATAVVLSGVLGAGCGKKKSTSQGNVTPQLMKATAGAALALELGDGAGLDASQASHVQSFTPTSMTMPIYRVNICTANSFCTPLYTCKGGTDAACAVELSNIQAFVDQLNAGAKSIDTGTYEFVTIQYTPDGDTSMTQHITVTGSVAIAGTTYGTDPTAGLKAGGTPAAVAFTNQGGGGSQYPINPPLLLGKGDSVNLRILFDPTLYAFAGDGSANAFSAGFDPGGSGCVGTASTTFVCTPITTLIGTVAAGTPTVEHYLVAWTQSTDGTPLLTAAPTGNITVYFDGSGSPIGGVQGSYFSSGASATWGKVLGGGIALFPTVVDATTLAFGQAPASSAGPVANPSGAAPLIFNSFKRATHTGTFTISGVSHTYSATKY